MWTSVCACVRACVRVNECSTRIKNVNGIDGWNELKDVVAANYVKHCVLKSINVKNILWKNPLRREKDGKNWEDRHEARQRQRAHKVQTRRIRNARTHGNMDEISVLCVCSSAFIVGVVGSYYYDSFEALLILFMDVCHRSSYFIVCVCAFFYSAFLSVHFFMHCKLIDTGIWWRGWAATNIERKKTDSTGSNSKRIRCVK